MGSLVGTQGSLETRSKTKQKLFAESSDLCQALLTLFIIPSIMNALSNPKHVSDTIRLQQRDDIKYTLSAT